ncbi:MAG: LCP family protein [Actinomycetota bacterium]
MTHWPDPYGPPSAEHPAERPLAHDDPPAVRRRRRPRRSWAERIVIGVAAMLILGLMMSAATLTWGLRRYQDIAFVPVPEANPAPAGSAENWLLVGSDSRAGIDPDDPNAGAFLAEAVEGTRTDTIIVARVDGAGRRVDLMSLPRDLWVPIAGGPTEGRINSAFNHTDGANRLVITVEDYLDIEINHYAEVDFVGFQSVIDALGGVPMWFDGPVRDANSGLDVGEAGCRTLTGSEALAFARSRKLEYHDGSSWRRDPTGDLGRTARQQHLLTQLAGHASATIDLTDLGTIDRVLRAGGSSLVVDDGVGASDLIGLARVLAGIGADGVVRHGLPVSPFRTSGGAEVLAGDLAAAQPTLEIFRGLGVLLPQPSEAAAADTSGDGTSGDGTDPTTPGTDGVSDPAGPALASIPLEVHNGAGVRGLAARTAEELEAHGFFVRELANASPPDDGLTTVHHPADLTTEAAAVGAVLSEQPAYQLDPTLDAVIVVLGREHAGVRDVAATTTTTAPETTTTAAAAVADTIVGVVPGPAPDGEVCS